MAKNAQVAKSLFISCNNLFQVVMTILISKSSTDDLLQLAGYLSKRVIHGLAAIFLTSCSNRQVTMLQRLDILAGRTC